VTATVGASEAFDSRASAWDFWEQDWKIRQASAPKIIPGKRRMDLRAGFMIVRLE
jgi:hypothetical protein